MTDIPLLIPLGSGSSHGDDELRYLLRSVERNVSGLERIYLMTTCKPHWLREDWSKGGIVVVPVKDTYTDNKDANLHSKTLHTLAAYDIDRFAWTADDACFMKPIRLEDIPVIHNHRDNGLFYQKDAGRWKKRVRNTLDWAKARGVELEHNFEAHCPQCFDGRLLLERMNGVDYMSQPGLTIYTTWRVMTDSWRDSHDQREWKQTFELEIDERPRTMSDEELCSKAFIGYSDAGVRAGILDRLRRHFPEKSKYER